MLAAGRVDLKDRRIVFESLKKRKLVDVGLNHVSQLAGFTRNDDLLDFTKAICNIEYVHLPDLAPTENTEGLHG